MHMPATLHLSYFCLTRCIRMHALGKHSLQQGGNTDVNNDNDAFCKLVRTMVPAVTRLDTCLLQLLFNC